MALGETLRWKWVKTYDGERGLGRRIIARDGQGQRDGLSQTRDEDDHGHDY